MQVENTTKNTQIPRVEHVTSMWGRVKGLMFQDAGRILMEFPRPGKYGIWMPFMKMCLDVAFLDEDKHVVHITRNVPPITLHPATWNVYKPEKPCTYILEAEAGLLEDWECGDQATF